MNTKYDIKNGNSIPVQTPRIAENSVNPYSIPDQKSISIVCRTKQDIVDKYLSVTPFDSISDIFWITFDDSTNYDGVEGPYQTMSLVVPVVHKGIVGGYKMLTYNNNSDVVLRNREVFGYPDKFASIMIDEDDEKITCTCHLLATGLPMGKKLVHAELDKTQPVKISIDTYQMGPDIILKTMGRPEGPGILYELAMSRDTTPDYKLKDKKETKAAISLLGCETDPLDEFGPVEILGGVIIRGDFHSTEENGWPVINEEVIPLID